MPEPTIYQNQLAALTSNALTAQSILDVFVLQDIIDFEDAEKLKNNFKTNKEIENFLIKNRLVTKDTINKAYSILLKVPYIGLKMIEIPQAAKDVLSKQVASKYGVIAFDVDGKLIRMAISRPADLLVGYTKGLFKLLESKNYYIEIFVTGDSDFREAIVQYDRKKSNQVLMKKGSFPVIYLRNMKIAKKYITKMPRDFVEKYRVVVFAENVYGGYMVACQEPDSPVTKKVLDYIEKENNIKIEAFAASKDDFDHLLKNYDNDSIGVDMSELDLKNEPVEVEKKDVVETAPEEKKGNISLSLEKFFGGENGGKSGITIDSVTNEGVSDDEMPSEEGRKELLKESQNRIVSVEAEGTQGQAIDAEKNQKTEIDKEEMTPKATEKELPLAEKMEDGATGANKIDSPQVSRVGLTFGGDSLETKDLGSILQSEVTDEKMLQQIVDEGYVPKIVAGVISYALNKKVSDIHIEPQAKALRIRTRIDGELVEISRMKIALHPPVISRVKIMAKLKIDESRAPQDGRFEVIMHDRAVDVRVSVLPTVHGEKIVLRILDKNQKILTLEDLGMRGTAFDDTLAAIGKPWGIILSTGPTGSGKSTTLNAIITRLNQPGVNISTLEDPVEYETPGVNQSQVKPEIGFTFASGLRSLLRQDPNIIMVGEIRDNETAAMTTHAALTGHLVLSTLHTNDTAGALPRLINMGIEPFLITSSVDLIIAQRLVRMICPKCKEELKVPPKLTQEIEEELNRIAPNNKKDLERIPADHKFYYGRGCDDCNKGYKGRIGLFEVMTITPEIESLAIERRPASEIKASAIEHGMISMKQDGLLKALAGETTLDEVFQATMDK